VNKRVKLRLLILLGICIYVPFISSSVMTKFYAGIVSYTVCFLLYGYFVYHFVQKREKPKYPMVPPEGRADIYYPRTNIPRPIYEDVRRYPGFFGRKKDKYRRTRRAKKKS
jgi:hypothetical protein